MKYLVMGFSALIMSAAVSANACECAYNACVTEAAGDKAKIEACAAKKDEPCTCTEEAKAAGGKCQCGAKDKAAKGKAKKK